METRRANNKLRQRKCPLCNFLFISPSICCPWLCKVSTGTKRGPFTSHLHVLIKSKLQKEIGKHLFCKVHSFVLWCEFEYL
ncbi:hypothetical protein ERO13_D01G168650v2 [Gossypium hirsutum]|uniref:Uncharacterized protein n=3 Tax=Gossypium TaxID=3633 RepID=A0A0D2RA57_GOSRA|nr:hypothetical protein ES319_D01G202700v1 [Gossypium barbadense]KAG4163381.1 hypothetical protein ERO13_D01G168650v2 [Gossypium hirsutum]KJB16035.1 hypothetical protein B456_002G209400 [Gossypium raimondii]TYI98362.1 hypothetical protein E1A91_D01G208900v1 [Gossypium mustelinum]